MISLSDGDILVNVHSRHIHVETRWIGGPVDE